MYLKTSSIFVKICSLDDTELAPTIMDAVIKSSNPQRLHFGVYLIYKNKESLQALESVVEEVKMYGARVKYEAKEYSKYLLGVGKARHTVDQMYNNQDWVLQIDSHSWFPYNWDQTLTELLMYQDPKTILTGYAGPYKYEESVRKPIGLGKLMYPKLSTEKVFANWLPENWQPIYPDVDDMFIPTKFCANFSFGTRKWGEYSGVFEKAIFFSEEPVQTMNLKSRGFKLLYPNIDEPMICHLYHQDINEYGSRLSISDYLGDFESDYLLNVMDKHYFTEYYGGNKRRGNLA